MSIEDRLREILVPVLGFDRVEQIAPEHSLINDLGADSIDFVELMHLIEVNFGVVVKTDEILAAGSNVKIDTLFKDAKLTNSGMIILKENFGQRAHAIYAGMSKFELFMLLTVRDMTKIIEAKMAQAEANA